MVKKVAFTIGNPRRNQTSFDMVKPLRIARRILTPCAHFALALCGGGSLVKVLTSFKVRIKYTTKDTESNSKFENILYIILRSFTLARRVYNEKTFMHFSNFIHCLCSFLKEYATMRRYTPYMQCYTV